MLRAKRNSKAQKAGDNRLVARLLRDSRGGIIDRGACRGCGTQAGYGLAEYEMQGRAPRIELCFLCEDCRERCGGLRIRFKLVYVPVWKEG